jgi:hypothetical protein
VRNYFGNVNGYIIMLLPGLDLLEFGDVMFTRFKEREICEVLLGVSFTA